MRIEKFDAAAGEKELLSFLENAKDADFVHVRHDFPDTQNLNMISISRKRFEYREALRITSRNGLHLYKLADNTSSFCSAAKIRDLWTEVESGPMRFSEKNVAYTLNGAVSGIKPKLLVIFSPVATKAHQSSLRRHFEHNFSSLQKYVPPNTHVLRIADLGGVNGGWYLPTNFSPNNAQNVQELIFQKCSDLGILPSEAVFYGVSKGGTAALYHALKTGARAVAVDPIVSDHYYAIEMDDQHFTIGNFPKTKDQIFGELKMDASKIVEGQISIIFSERSHQYSYLNRLLLPWTKDKVSYINVRDPNIKDHPDVGPNSVSTTVMLINMKLHGIKMASGVISAPF